MRFFALGDSLAEGISDVASNELTTPFPQVMADSLAAGGVDVVAGSSAWRGADAHDGATRQSRRAESFRPDLAVMWLGLNDLLKLSFDRAGVQRDLEATAWRLRDRGACVLTASMPLPSDVLALPGWSVRRLSDRVEVLNEVVGGIAHRVGAIHLDVARTADRLGRDVMFGPDGVHFTAAGHHGVAADYLEALRGWGIADVDVVPAPPVSRLRGRDRTAWYATRGTGYAVRRLGTGRVGPEQQP